MEPSDVQAYGDFCTDLDGGRVFDFVVLQAGISVQRKCLLADDTVGDIRGNHGSASEVVHEDVGNSRGW